MYFNTRTNLLESAEQNYPLVSVKDPNLFREYFQYDEVPKVVFNRRIVPMEMPSAMGSNPASPIP